MTRSALTSNRKRSINGIAAALVALVIASGALWWATSYTAPKPLPVLPDGQSAPTDDHVSFGPVRPPRPLPAISLTMDDGGMSMLPEVVAGKWTMLHLMFASCSTTCPIQGAVFALTQQILGERGASIDMLSISIDPGGDSPEALHKWLDDMDAGPGWRAGLPGYDGLGTLVDTLDGRGQSIDVHLARVYIVDPDGQVVYATEELPDPEALAGLALEAIGSR